MYFKVMICMAKTKLKTVYKIKWKNLLVCLLIILLVVLVYLGGSYIFNFLKDYSTTKNIINNIYQKIEVKQIVDDEFTKTIPPDSSLSKFDVYWDYIKLSLIDVDMESLKRINSDTIGYMQVMGTDYSYPILEYKDGFYKNHSFDKKENSLGWIYLSEANNVESIGTNNIILGNKTYANILTNKLKDVFKQDWQKNNDNFLIKYTTNYYTSLWQIISIYKTKDKNYLKTTFSSEDELKEFIKESIDKSEYYFKTEAYPTDKFITLSTSSNNENMVVLAKLIKIKETN